jgi:hypothetical protein
MKHRTLATTLGLAACLTLGAGAFAQTAPTPAPATMATPGPSASSMPGGTMTSAPAILVSPPPGTTVIPGEVPSDNGTGIRRLLSQQNNSGELGSVTLFRLPNNKTRVVLNLKGAKPGTMQPAHIHRGRDCSNLDPKPAYPLTTVMTSASGGSSTTIVNAPIAKLLSGNYSVNVHASTTNIARYVSCGNLYLK